MCFCACGRYEKSFLDVHVVFKKISVIVHVHHDTTVAALTDMAYAALKKRFDASTSSSSSVPSSSSSKASAAGAEAVLVAEEEATPFPERACVRLRVFDSIRGVLMGPLGSFGVTAPSGKARSGSECKDDGETDHHASVPSEPGAVVIKSIASEIMRRQQHVEVRPSDGEFEEAEGEKVPLEVAIFQPSAVNMVGERAGAVFCAPVPFSISASASSADLIAATVKAARGASSSSSTLTDGDAVVCLFGVQTGHVQQVLASGEAASQLVKAGDRLYVDLGPMLGVAVGEEGEVVENAMDASAPRLVNYFNAIHNRITVCFSVAASVSGVTSRSAGGSVDAAGTEVVGGDLRFDQRLPLRALKHAISKALGEGWPIESFR